MILPKKKIAHLRIFLTVSKLRSIKAKFRQNIGLFYIIESVGQKWDKHFFHTFWLSQKNIKTQSKLKKDHQLGFQTGRSFSRLTPNSVRASRKSDISLCTQKGSGTNFSKTCKLSHIGTLFQDSFKFCISTPYPLQYAWGIICPCVTKFCPSSQNNFWGTPYGCNTQPTATLLNP